MNRLLAFAIAVFVLQQVPAFTGRNGTWIDLVTPFVVIGFAAWVLRDAPGSALAVALVAGVAFVDGHGIHFASNEIGHYGLTGKADDVRYFWDEHWGHIEWHLGLLGLLAAFALADSRRSRPDRADLAAAVLLGWTLFTNTVEGQDWFVTLAAAAVFAVWAIARRTRTLVACASATLFAAALIGIWAAWHGGVPQFSELGWF